jgi:hypothetical protein
MSCVVCHEPGPNLCSWTCLRSATAELDENMISLHSLGPGESERRYELAARNGQLTSALIRHPQPPRADQAAS